MPRKETKTERVTSRIPVGLYKKIKEVCDAQGYNVSIVVQTAIEFYLRDLELRERYPGFVGMSDQRKVQDLLDDEAFLEALARKMKEKEKEEGR